MTLQQVAQQSGFPAVHLSVDVACRRHFTATVVFWAWCRKKNLFLVSGIPHTLSHALCF